MFFLGEKFGEKLMLKLGLTSGYTSPSSFRDDSGRSAVHVQALAYLMPLLVKWPPF